MGRPITRENGPQQPILTFSARHHEIMRRLLVGQTQREIAHDLDMNEGRLSIIINSPLFQLKLREYQQKVGDRLIDNLSDVSNRVRLLQPKALDTIQELLEKKGNDRLRRDCARDIFELGGSLGKRRDEDGMNDFARIIADAFKKATDLKQGINNVIDITPESISAGTTNDTNNAHDTSLAPGSLSNSASPPIHDSTPNPAEINVDPIDEASSLAIEARENEREEAQQKEQARENNHDTNNGDGETPNTISIEVATKFFKSQGISINQLLNEITKD